jgi:hypothetical protein
LSKPPSSASLARNEVRKVAPKLIELSEKVPDGDKLITHVAFYAGWPAAMTAGRIARKILDENQP